MMKKYHDYNEIYTDFPNFCAIHVEYSYGNMVDIRLCTDLAYFGAELWDNNWHTNWQLVQGVLKDDWFSEAFQLKQLKGLSLWMDKRVATTLYENLPSELSPNLEKLRWAVRTETPVNIQIPCLPHLKTLILSGWNEVKITARLDALEQLTLHQIHTLDLPTLASHLNPECLAYLSIKNAPKIFLKNPSSSHSLETFYNLQELHVSKNKLSKLPFKCANFLRLEHLDISHNKLEPFPLDVLSLPALQKLDITQTHIVKKKFVRGGSELLKLMKEFEKNELSEADKGALWGILLEDNALTATLTLEKAIGLLHKTSYPLLIKKIHAWCAGTLPDNPLLGVEEVKHLTVLGKIPTMMLKELKDFFKNYHIQVTSDITSKTQVICIGEKLSSKQVASLSQRPPQIPICFPTHLRLFMEHLEVPYLTVIDANAAQNLENLLLSDDLSNQMIALQMLKTGGLPPLIFELLCLEHIRHEWKIRKEALQLLEKYATPQQFIVLKKMGDKRFGVEQSLTFVFFSGVFDSKKLVQAVLKFYSPHKSGIHQDYFLYVLKGLIWKCEGEAFELILDHYLQENGTLIIEDTSMQMPKIPQNLKHNPRIKKIIMLDHIGQKPCKSVIKSLPNLKELEVLYQIPHKNKKIEETKRAYYTQLFPDLSIILTSYTGNLKSY